MTSNEALLTIAEIAIATIGFAGIVSALRPKASHAADAMHRLRLRLMVEASASVMIYAFLPFVLAGFVSEQQTWAIGSGVIAFTSPIHVGSIYNRQRRIFGSALLRDTLLFDTSVIITASLEAAFAAAAASAQSGETVLLAPACASHDAFSSFEARGDAFAELARALPC